MRDHALVHVVPDSFGTTWGNGRTRGDGIAKRIDRLLICESVFLHLPHLETSIIADSILDHKSIMLAWRGEFDNNSYPFKFNLR